MSDQTDIKVGSAIRVSIGIGSDFLGNFPYIEILEVFDTIIAYRFVQDEETILFMTKERWLKLQREQPGNPKITTIKNKEQA